MYNVLQVARRMSCNNAWVWPIDGGQEVLKGGRWALGRMGDGRWALGDAASSCWSATTSGKRGKLGGGNQRCSHFKDDTSSFLLLLLTSPPSNKKDGRLQEYLQLLGKTTRHNILFELCNQILMAAHLKGMFNWSQLVSAPSSVIRLYCHVRMWHHIEIFSSPNKDGWCYEKISSPVCVK